MKIYIVISVLYPRPTEAVAIVDYCGHNIFEALRVANDNSSDKVEVWARGEKVGQLEKSNGLYNRTIVTD